MLELMNFQPPPEIEQVVKPLQDVLRQILSDSDDSLRSYHGRTGHASKAQVDLAVYAFHLERVIRAANTADGKGQVSLRREVQTAVAHGAVAIAPAAISAGLVGAVFPPAAVPVGIATVMTVGAQEALKKLFEVAGVALASHFLQPVLEHARGAEYRRAAVEQLIRTSESLFDELSSNPASERALRALALEGHYWIDIIEGKMHDPPSVASAIRTNLEIIRDGLFEISPGRMYGTRDEATSIAHRIRRAARACLVTGVVPLRMSLGGA